MLHNPTRVGYCPLGETECLFYCQEDNAEYCGQHKIKGSARTLDTNKIEEMERCPLETEE